MIVTLQRYEQDASGMHGMMMIDGEMLCYTLEQPWRDNAHKISCIPSGTYKCTPHNSPKHPDTWLLNDVPDRADILIHTGNTLADTEGCILVGMKSTKQGIEKSRDAMDALHANLPDNFFLEICPPITLRKG